MYACEIKKSEIEPTMMPTTTMYGGLTGITGTGLNGSGIEGGMTGGPSTWYGGRTTDVESTYGGYTQPIYGGDIVISGISGRFPYSENVEEFSRNLFYGTEMYEGEDFGLPKRFEKLRMVNQFDNKFFGINDREVEVMDPKLKVLLQVAYEAIFDSGFNPIELKGTKTGIFIGSTGIEVPTTTIGGGIEESLIGYSSLPTCGGFTGGINGLLTPNMLVNRISKYFDFKGPSYWIDTTYTNGLIVLDQAINAIKSGICEQAIVGGINFNMDEKKMYEKYGCSIPEDMKITYINGVNGESVSFVFLTKRSFSRRFYAKVLHSKMYMEPSQYESGYNYKNDESVLNVLRKVYSECQINPSDVTYVESHGVRMVGCDETFEPITQFFGKTRTTPLYIGSTVPYTGHSDSVSGITGLVKMIVAIQKGTIPTREVKVFVDGKLKVVERKTKFNCGLMALNSIGLNGLVHVVLQPHFEWMMNKYEPTSFWNKDLSTISRQPRLFTFSGRSEQELTNIFEHVHTCPTDLAAHVLLNTHSNTTPITHPYRGFTILNGSRKLREIKKCVVGEKRPVWYVFSGMGTNWSGMGKDLMKIECFRNSIYKSASLLRPYNIDLVHLLLKEEHERILYQSVMIPAIQIALVDCLKTLGVEPEGIVGHSFGEIVAAYVDGCLTHEESILTSYYRGKFIEEANLPTGSMAIVGLTWEELQRQCPSTIVPAFFNSTDSVVVSGPKRAIVQFVEELRVRGIYAKEINSNGIALHSYFLTPIIPQYKEVIEKIIRSRKMRSQRWISTTIPEYKWESEECKYITPEYFLNNLINPVYFQQAIKRIPRNAITIEIGPRSVLKKVLAKSLGEQMTLVDFIKPESTSQMDYFWGAFGKLYSEGINFDLMKLIVPVECERSSIYPVPIKTKFLSPLVSEYLTKEYVEPITSFTYPHLPTGYPTSTEYPLYDGEYNKYPFEYRYPTEYRTTTPSVYSTTMPSTVYPTVYPTVASRKYETITPIAGGVVPSLVVPTEFQAETKYSKTLMYEIDLSSGSEFEFLTGHKIDGRITYPVSGYLYLIWKSLAKIRNVEIEELPVAFENVEVHRPTIITGKSVKFYVKLDQVTGKFEIIENQVVVSSGRVFVPEDRTFEMPEFNVQSWLKTRSDLLELEEIYKELKLRGYCYTDLFKGIARSNIEGTRGELMWGGKWIPFLESMFQMHTLGKQGLQLPTQIKSLRIDPRIHIKNLIRHDLNSNYYVPTPTTTITTPFVKPTTFESIFGVLPVIYNPYTRKCVSGGVECSGLYSTSLPKTYFNEPVVLERVNFVPYFEKRGIDEEYYVPEVEYRPQYEYVDTYLNECKHHLSTILRNLEYPTYTGIYPTVPTTTTPFVRPTVEGLFCGNKFTNGKFLRLLKELSTIECDQQYIKTLRSIFADKFQLYDAWHNDTIFNTINRDAYLKSCLDTVYENVPFDYTTKVPKLRILEIAPVMNVLAPRVSSFLSTYPKVTVDYHYVPVGEISDEIFNELKLRSSFPINKVEWNIRTQEYPTCIPTLKDFDLIIFNGSLGSLPFFEDKIMMKTWLNNISERMLKREGFFMFNEFVNHFETINHLRRLEQLVFKPTINVTGGDFINQKYLAEGEWRRLFEEGCGLHPVSLKSDSILSTLFLYRKPRFTTSSILPRGGEYETSSMRLREHEIYINEVESFNWIEKVKQALNEPTFERIWLICENAPTSGIVGLVNALRRELRGDRIRCVFIADTIGKPWTTYFDMIKKSDLVMNVYKNGKWGAYRGLRDLVEYERPTTTTFLNNENIMNVHLNILNRGDLSTLSWVQSPEPYVKDINNEMIVKVGYAGLNYRDVLYATGKVVPKYSGLYDNVFGMEFSGCVKDKRYMGLTTRRGLSTSLIADLRHCWELPREWTLEQAATVPFSYASAYYTLVVKGGLKRGESVLIHSGATPFGQAAIAIALQYDCKVFVTVGTKEKREFLMSMFPGRLTEESFCSSKDLFFEKHIMRITQGKGVDVVLNTWFGGEKLQASIRCLSPYSGRFLDITCNDLVTPSTFGGYPTINNNTYKNIIMHTINFDSLFEPESYEWKRVHQLVEEGIRSGVVRPIRSTVFDRSYVEDAFKHMLSRKPIHKVLVKVGVWEPKEFLNNNYFGGIQQQQTVTVVPKMWFSPYHTYVITGGLSSFGLELATFLVERGVRKLLLTSKYGVSSAYQTEKLQYLQDKFGAIISVSNYDVKVESECVALLKEAIELSEEKRLGGIFHLETVIEECNLDLQLPERFKYVLEKKYLSTYFLDKYTRSMDGFFVVFSSSPIEETTYPVGYATSAIERLCELRRQDGKHAVVIQWGPFGEVFERENEFLMNGTISEKIPSCLNTLERILLRKGDSNTIWSCYQPTCQTTYPTTYPTTYGTSSSYPTKIKYESVMPFRYPTTTTTSSNTKMFLGGGSNKLFNGYPTIVEYIRSIIPSSSVESMTTGQFSYSDVINSQTSKYLRPIVSTSTLIDLGLELSTIYEIKSFLEQYYNCLMTLRDVQLLTLEKILKIEQSYPILSQFRDFKESREVKEWKGIVPKYNYLMPRRPLEKLNTIELTSSLPVVIIHPIEGHVNMLKTWAKHMKYPVYGMQFTSDALCCESVEALAEYYWQQLEKEFKNVTRFHLAGYSFGSSVAFEMALKKSGRIASLTFLDGSYSYINSYLNPYRSKFDLNNLAETEAECLYTFISQYTQIPCRRQFIQSLMTLSGLEERIKYAAKELYTRSQFTFDPVDLELAAKSFVSKMLMSFKYQPKSVLRIPEMLLIKPTQRNDINEIFGEDYGLNQVFSGKLRVFPVEGDQRSFMESTGAVKVASILNDYLMQYF